jgi:hypothetical protein
MTEIDDEEMPVKGTKTHPYLAVLRIDPVDWSDLEAAVEDRPEMKVRMVDRDQPDIWTAYIACASEAVKERLEKTW